MPQVLNQPSIVDHRKLLDRYFNSSVRRKPIIIRYSVCSPLIYTPYQRIQATYLSCWRQVILLAFPLIHALLMIYLSDIGYPSGLG